MTLAHPPGVDVTSLPTNGKPACQCVRWHRPVPAEDEIHHIVPRGAPFHGPDIEPNRVELCPTTHSAVHACIRVHLKAHKGDRVPSAAELRPYTRYVKLLAQRAMDALGPQADIDLNP
jgi:hypothetical protein